MVAASVWSLLVPAMEVVVVELIPEVSAGEHSNPGTLFFAAGFTVMLALG